ncbi:MAG: STAS domain-containing protein [Ruminococcaceae bacterium]|nr:STAS domain-containing protein [Oscillospiraceae bacterium]
MLKKNCFLDIIEESGTLTVRLFGEIDHHSAVRVRTEIDEKISSCHPKITVIDLSGIEFMDSSGLGLIMGRYMKMQAIGGVLLLRNPNERMVKIFKLAGLEKIVNIETKEVKNETK